MKSEEEVAPPVEVEVELRPESPKEEEKSEEVVVEQEEAPSEKEEAEPESTTKAPEPVREEEPVAPMERNLVAVEPVTVSVPEPVV